MTLLHAFIISAAIFVPLFIIMLLVPMPEHSITKIRKRNEEIARLTDALAASEAQNKELREAGRGVCDTQGMSLYHLELLDKALSGGG